MPASVIVDVVTSSAVPEPPVPEVGTRRGTSVDATGPMTGWATGDGDERRIGELIGVPLPSSGAIM